MAHSKWCGKVCSECKESFCPVDEKIPCSPDCEAINPRLNLPDREFCVGCGADLIEVTSDEALEIIQTYEPKGMFYLNIEGVYIGIDNVTGDAWTEEFDNKER
jgi:hypothetical protein